MEKRRRCLIDYESERGGTLKTLKIRVLVLAAGLLLVSCMLVEPQAVPERPVATKDLLIGLHDMPEGWVVTDGPEDSPWEINVDEGFWIGFEAVDSMPHRKASHEICRYDNARKAAIIYEDLVVPYHYGETPAGWTYQSLLADQYHFTCYTYTGYTNPICEWSGVYEEYIVIFNSGLIPERMSLEDMERIIQTIETRMEQNLQKP